MDRPQCFHYWDWSVSYLLPDECVTNIPRRGPGLGAHNSARGFLVELVRRLQAEPLLLHYTEHARPAWRPDYQRVLVTAVVDSPRFGRVRATSISSYRHASDTESWAVLVNGRVLTDEIRRYPPSPPYTAFLIDRALRAHTTGPAHVATRPAALPRPRPDLLTAAAGAR